MKFILISWPPTFEWVYYEIQHILTIIFFIIILKPLWTLTKNRPVLIIVFSKTILSLIDVVGQLLARTANRIFIDFLETTLYIWRLHDKAMHDMLQNAVLMHVTALAINRMHCIMWPFHYKSWIGRRKIVMQCILLWILGTLMATVVALLNMHSYIHLASSGILSIAIFLYIIVGAKLAWKKYYLRTSIHLHSMVEKDFNKITIVCLSSLLPIFVFFVTQTIALEYQYDTQMIQTITGPFIYCADELCLMILIADFRRIIKEFLLCRGNGRRNGSNIRNRVGVMQISNNGMLPTSSAPVH